MSLSINIDKVKWVMLTNSPQWFEVKWREDGVSSFTMDAYEYCDSEGEEYHGGGQSGVCSTGASWIDGANGKAIFCPLTAIQAVGY